VKSPLDGPLVPAANTRSQALAIMYIDMTHQSLTFRQLPTEQLIPDPEYLRSDLFDAAHDDRLLRRSIEEHGVLSPVNVMQLTDDFYMIIDGLRRVVLAHDLGFPAVPCMVIPKFDRSDMLRLRNDLQNTYR
jgi:ParB-like chromosome segregation protein Spo0J